MKLTMNELENCFNAAKEKGAEYIGLAITLRGTNKKEVIINPKENFDIKLAYYKNAYSDVLDLKNVDGISIVGFTYGNSFDEIEKDLIGRGSEVNAN